MSSRFPTPVGGTPLPVDFAPSIIFAVLYGIISPLLFFRLLDKRSRTVLLIGTAVFSIERSALHLSFKTKTNADSVLQNSYILSTRNASAKCN